MKRTASLAIGIFYLAFRPLCDPTHLGLVCTIKTATARFSGAQFAAELARFYWKPVWWSGSYFLVFSWRGPVRGIEDYIEKQTGGA